MINWNRKLQAPGVRLVVLTRTAHGLMERDATVLDMQHLLHPLGFEVTAKDAVDWDTRYPHEAANLTRICVLQQRIADLRHRLRQNSRLRRVAP